MPAHLADHLASGGHSPGIFILRSRYRVEEVIEFLQAAAYASEPSEWQDRVAFIP